MPSKARTCFVPGCRSGYRGCKDKSSLFRPPKDAARRELWARNIKRADKELTTDCVVCERHFQLKYIERNFRHVINGERVEFPRDRPQLSDDAIPTVFPDAPKYFTKKTPVKRKERNLCNQALKPPKQKRTRTTNNAQSEKLSHLHDATDFSPSLSACQIRLASEHLGCNERKMDAKK